MGKYKIYSGKTSVRDLKISSIRLPKNPKKFIDGLSSSRTRGSRKEFLSGFPIRSGMTNALAKIRTSNLYGWINPNTYTGLRRLAHQIVLLAITVLLIFSAISPLFELYISHKYYSLNSKTSNLVGEVGANLAKQISYDYTSDAYIFNKDGMKAMTTTVGPDKVPLALLQAKVGGDKTKSKSLYAVTMPTDPKAGITYYDSNTGLSFSMVPGFTQMNAKQVDNHIVYPINKDMQLAYSVKNNGLKEDIIMKKFTTDSFSYSYSLKLPDTLEARMLTNGSGELGIYSADPSLFNGSSALGDDTAKLESAKLHAKKDHLLFAIPTPVINGTENGERGTKNGGQGTASASFNLSSDKDTLTVSAKNLKTLKYPVSVDPTVVITSTSDFGIVNNEDNNITNPAGQINNGSLTGGSISGGWTGTTALPTANGYSASVAYNGFVYEVGGYNGTTTVSTVSYAAINANGTIGSWTGTTALPTATDGANAIAYNGYLYVIGGFTTATTAVVDYAPINANGTIGSWTATTALPTATTVATSVVYNGYLYEIGGWNGTTIFTTVDYAPINADGTIGTWTGTTALPTATRESTSVVYNGYLYEIGGYATPITATVDYAPINANGTIGAWTATTSLPTATDDATSVVYNGYVYEIGGNTGSLTAVVDYAPINANGTIGSWTASVSIPTATDVSSSIVYNGYLYEIGGIAGVVTATVSYAKIDPAGYTTSYTSTTALPATTRDATSVAYNGYLYEIGGIVGGSQSAVVDYAPINANGTIGSWTATTSIPTITSDATSVAYNGYLYEIGGNIAGTIGTTVDYAPISSNGTIGSWTATTVLPAPAENEGSVAYNGYLYEIGGDTTGGTKLATVYYVPINANGTIGSWTATTSLPVATTTATSVIYNGYLYEIGGAASGLTSVVDYAPINANGTIGSWTATTSLPIATNHSNSVAYNGYLYEIGGYTGSCTTAVYYSLLNSNGTIGSWTATTSLPAATGWATSVVYNGNIYEIGGWNLTTTFTTVEYATINNGGPGTTGAWNTTAVLPAATWSAGSATYNGYVYQIGGYVAGSPVTTVNYALINADGTLGAWAATTVLPVATRSTSSVAYNGYLYMVGGYSPSVTSAVYYAPINPLGTIGSWVAANSLPIATGNTATVAYNGYIYNIAGAQGGSAVTTVYYAVINTGGSIGSWNTTNSLSVANAGVSAFAYNGYMYSISGSGSAGAGINTAYYAPINSSTGALGSWVATTTLPAAVTGSSNVVASNGYAYSIGGYTGGGVVNTYYAPINANGTLGDWTPATNLPLARYSAVTVIYNGYIYEIGGGNGGSGTTTSYYAPLNVMPRVARYSQLFNFGSAGITPFSLTYGGNLPNAFGLSPISYKTATSNGIFGASQYSTALNGTTTDCNTVGTIQYILVTLTLDDTNNAAFADVSNTTGSNATDLTITYNTYDPPPNLRLRGGKFFSSNALQPLDTCAFVPVPNRPTIGTTTDSGSGRAYNNGSAVVSFTPSASGYAATSYTVTASSGGYSATGTASPLTVYALQSGTSYTFTVTAKNAIGSSNSSAASNSITATTIPQPPTIGTATAGNASATVAFTGNGTGGLSNTYTATSSPSSITGTGASPITVSGLSNGTAYTFTVTATNANGTSASSAASNSVTPIVPFPVVTGGTLASDATYYYRTFTSSGTVGVTSGSINFDYLVVAGGGAGGGNQWQAAFSGYGAGGGGGGVLSGSSTLSNNTLAVTVGSGGTGVSGASNGGNGNNSQLGALATATGGGGGGYYLEPSSATPAGSSGGSGGGGGITWNGSLPIFYGVGGAGIAGQGNAGGTGTSGNIGGGGGASGAGNSGTGGAGTSAYSSWGLATSTGYNVSGTVYYSAGAGGGAGLGGVGLAAGNPNTGQGGGGQQSVNPGAGYSGGSGVVIIRYTRSQVGG